MELHTRRTGKPFLPKHSEIVLGDTLEELSMTARMPVVITTIPTQILKDKVIAKMVKIAETTDEPRGVYN